MKHNYFSLTIHFLQISTFLYSVQSTPGAPRLCSWFQSHMHARAVGGDNSVVRGLCLEVPRHRHRYQPCCRFYLVWGYLCGCLFEDRPGLPGLSPRVVWLCWAVAGSVLLVCGTNCTCMATLSCPCAIARAPATVASAAWFLQERYPGIVHKPSCRGWGTCARTFAATAASAPSLINVVWTLA